MMKTSKSLVGYVIFQRDFGYSFPTASWSCWPKYLSIGWSTPSFRDSTKSLPTSTANTLLALLTIWPRPRRKTYVLQTNRPVIILQCLVMLFSSSSSSSFAGLYGTFGLGGPSHGLHSATSGCAGHTHHHSVCQNHQLRRRFYHSGRFRLFDFLPNFEQHHYTWQSLRPDWSSSKSEDRTCHLQHNYYL